MGSNPVPHNADQAIKDFLARADPELVKRFMARELTLVFAEVNPIASALAGCSIEEAFAQLKAMPAKERNKYGAAVKVRMPTGDALIDRILTDLYGRTYRPPVTPRTSTSRARSSSSSSSRAAKVPTLSPDDAIRLLEAATTVAEARSALDQMNKRSKADHQKVASFFGVVYVDSTTIKVLDDRIVDMVLAERRFEPLQRGGMR